ncbi:hypothetical protein SAE02_66910 [Skermanella aerolata]|uniref:DDE domain-containing protein n=1 Tax=Skermanella aerolata TaxID=393310 RepID=A0A512E1E4_9PROT|nr:hypothetical protein SAE02_66910 [Skermanella aerolata]
MPGVEHRQYKGINNRAENSHQPTRRRERQMNGSVTESCCYNDVSVRLDNLDALNNSDAKSQR